MGATDKREHGRGGGVTATDEWQFTPDGSEEGMAFKNLPNGVRIFDARHLWSDGFGGGSPLEKIGYAVHHAVTELGNGTIRGDLAIIGAIHAWHTGTPGNGWPGIGYHRIIGTGKRIYMVGASSSVRAHVSNLNHKWIGWCFLGNWANGRPPADMIEAFTVGTQWETDQRGVEMQLAPHKRLEAAGTECPGSWAFVDSWKDITLKPKSALPAPPPQPPTKTHKQKVVDQLNIVQAEANRLRELVEAMPEVK